MTHPAPFLLHVLTLALPPLLIGLSLPLILGRVKPNLWYGVRTRRTLSSPELWYRANRLGGMYLAVGTLMAMAAWVVLAFLPLAGRVRAGVELGILAGSSIVASVLVLVKVQKM